MAGKMSSPYLLAKTKNKAKNHTKEQPVYTKAGTITQKNKIETDKAKTTRGMASREGMPNRKPLGHIIKHSDIGLFAVK